MEIKIIKKFWTVSIITLLLGLTFSSYVYASNPIINEGDEKERWAVLICGSVEEDAQGLDTTFRKTTKQAYETFKKLGYDDDHIYFLQGKNLSDDDEDNLPEGADGFCNKSNAKYAITSWLANNSDENDDCFIFMIGHGSFRIPKSTPRLKNGDSTFSIYDYVSEEQEYIWGYELAEWLDQISYNVCTVFIFACFSGGFIKRISGENRIIMTSAKLELSVGSITGDLASFFFDKLRENVSYGEAWEYAGKIHRNVKIRDLPAGTSFIKKILARIGFIVQSPQIDDNGDGRGSGRRFIADKLPIRKDGYLALSTYPS
jgi:hypothetical protein